MEKILKKNLKCIEKREDEDKKKEKMVTLKRG